MIKKEQTPRFELVINVKDNSGRPTGKKKSISSNSGEDLEGFWMRHNPENKNRNNSNKKRAKGRPDTETVKTILNKKIEKLRTLGPDWDDAGGSAFTESTLETAKSIINNVVDAIKVHTKIIPKNTGEVVIDLSSISPEQSLEISVLENQFSYSFWSSSNKSVLNQEYSEIDFPAIRGLIENFNKNMA